jgi:hypothetical protein
MTWVGRGTAAVVLVALAAGGCGTPNDAANSPGPPSRSASPTASPSVAATRAPTPAELAATPSELARKLPPGVPVMPDAESARLPDDPSVVARWTVPQVGSGVYDWYVKALPAAGFEIVGTYPSDRAALIRFRDSAGRTWQLLAELVGDRTQISVQTDRP